MLLNLHLYAALAFLTSHEQALLSAYQGNRFQLITTLSVYHLQISMTVIPGMTYFPKRGKVLGRSLVIVDNMAHVLIVSTRILVGVTLGGMEPSVRLVCYKCQNVYLVKKSFAVETICL